MEARFVGVELYFADLQRAKDFYTKTLGLAVDEEQSGHFVKLGNSNSGFICLERKGSESYPSSDKAVLFFEVDDLAAEVVVLGRELFVEIHPQWAVLHDPEGHKVLLLQRSETKAGGAMQES
jgi:predicted enzyme related to lactoylglutathione lyase